MCLHACGCLHCWCCVNVANLSCLPTATQNTRFANNLAAILLTCFFCILCLTLNIVVLITPWPTTWRRGFETTSGRHVPGIWSARGDCHSDIVTLDAGCRRGQRNIISKKVTIVWLWRWRWCNGDDGRWLCSFSHWWRVSQFDICAVRTQKTCKWLSAWVSEWVTAWVCWVLTVHVTHALQASARKLTSQVICLIHSIAIANLWGIWISES